MKETLASRILPNNKEVRGHVDSEKFELCKNALDFFCNKFKKESSEDAAWDTQEEFNIPIRVENFYEEPMHVYDVYIG